MKRVQIPITGISTAASYADGACASISNLRHRNGSLLPILPKEIYADLSQAYQLIFVHTIGDWECWLGAINSEETGCELWADIKGEPNVPVLALSGTYINSIEQIGSTITVLTTTGLRYLLRDVEQPSGYRVLGEMPDLEGIEVEITTEDVPRNLHEDYVAEPGAFLVDGEHYYFPPKNMQGSTLRDMIKGSFAAVEAKRKEDNEPLFWDACYLRLAFRLYDGSYAKPTAPILLAPESSLIQSKYYYYKVGKPSLEDNLYVLAYKLINDVKVSDSWVMSTGFKSTISLPGIDVVDWKDIIKSIGVFISRPLGISNTDYFKRELTISANFPEQQGPIMDSLPADTDYKVRNTDLFYLLTEITLDSETPSPIEIPSAESATAYYNLEQQEQLIDNSSSWQKLSARKSTVYNQRLHIADITTDAYGGFPISDVVVRAPGYNGTVALDGASHIGSFAAVIKLSDGGVVIKRLTKEYAPNTDYNFTPVFSYPDVRAMKADLYFYSQEYTPAGWYLQKEMSLVEHPGLPIAIYVENDLTPILTQLSFSGTFIEAPTSNNLAELLGVEAQVALNFSDPNKLKVSQVENPFVFPDELTYRIGTGRIRALASNAFKVADGQFGQYPMYVFTMDGIYALSIGSGAVLYEVQSLVSPELPVSDVVCNSPYGIAFIAARGLYVIQGVQVQSISKEIELPHFSVDIDVPEKAATRIVVDANDTGFLEEYLTGLVFMFYDYKERELVVYSSEFDYAYHFCFDSKTWVTATGKYSGLVGNTFPNNYLFLNEDERWTVFDFQTDGSDNALCSFITRLLSFGTPDIKKVDRFIIRGVFKDGYVPVLEEGEEADTYNMVALYEGSKDDVNTYTMRGLALKPGNYKDIDSGLIASNKFRQHLVGFGGYLAKGSRIDYIEAEVVTDFNNEKMR